MKEILGNRRLHWLILLVFIIHTALLIITLPAIYVRNAQSEQPVELISLTLRSAWDIYSWALITLFILWVGFYFRITRSHLWRNLFIHLLTSILAAMVRTVVYKAGLWLVGFGSFGNIFNDFYNSAVLVQMLTGGIVHYPSIIGIQQAYLYFRESQERAFRLQQAELEMLKMQLQPHFFFNTLNAISALLYGSPKKADQLITQLGDLFRVSLKKNKEQEITLKEEVEFLQSFLEIHQTLIGKRLKIEWEINAETLDAAVPNLLLQPLAENAIKHGIAPLEAGGRIKIYADRQNGKLLLQMYNDGMGFVPKDEDNGSSIGLINTRSRLRNLYNGNHTFSIDELKDGGVSIKIEIPFREIVMKEDEN